MRSSRRKRAEERAELSHQDGRVLLTTGDHGLLRSKERTQFLVGFPTGSARRQFLSRELPIIVCLLKKHKTLLQEPESASLF